MYARTHLTALLWCGRRRGWNLYGQLGHGHSADAYSPSPVLHFLNAGAMARKVCCGEVPTHTHTHARI